MEILSWIAKNIFGNPVFLIGFIVLLGLLLQKKTLSQVMTGTLKAVIGFVIITAGSSIISNALEVFEPMWKEVFQLQESNLGNYLGQEKFNARFGSAVALAMTLGFFLNILLARFTKLKYIYLTGHLMFWSTTIVIAVLIHINPTLSYWKIVTFASILMGIYWTIQPAILQPFLRKIVGNDQIAMGHTSASAAFLSALAGKIIGNKENSTEQLKVPKGLEFLRDSNVITALVMSILFTIGAIILMMQSTPTAKELIAKADGQNFVMYSIVQSFTFAGGIAVVLMGVRMFIGEIVPAFNGIATKLVPGAKPALDCPIIFPYAPNAVIIGFFGAFLGAILWLIVMGNVVAYVFVPSMIVLFFNSASAAVYGNLTGGVRGAFFGGFLNATLVAWGQYILVKFFVSSTIPDTVLWAADSDMFLLGVIAGYLGKLL